MRIPATIISLMVSAALGGCSALGGPGASATTSVKLEQAQRAHEYPSTAPAAQTASGGERSAVEAIRAFASDYINWTADTVAADMRSLASRTVGQARSAMELAAAQSAQDYELQRGGIANSGTVEAIAPLLGHRDQYVVVTREETSSTNSTAYDGLRPAWHLALVGVLQIGQGRWAVNRWQPEN